MVAHGAILSDSQKPFDILGTFADPSSFDTGAARLTNVRVVARQATEKRPSKTRLVGTPGLTTICTPVSGLAGYTTPSAVLALCRGPSLVGQSGPSTIWSIHQNGAVFSGVETATPLFRGVLDFGANFPPPPPYPTYFVARMAELKTQIAVAVNYDNQSPGQNGFGVGFVLNTAFAGSDIPVLNFWSTINFDPTAVCVLDNIAIWGGGGGLGIGGPPNFRMYASAVGDCTNVKTTAFASKEGRSDALIDLAVSVRYFYAFGEGSTEINYDAGNSADFPFVPFTNILVDVGLANRRTLANIHGNLMWVGTDCRVWYGYAQSMGPVSPAWLDLELQRLSNSGHLQELTAYMYSQGGDEFYVLTRPGFWTLEMALSTKIWNYVQSNGRVDSARRCAVEFKNGVTYVGLDTGQICSLDITNASEPAGVMPRTMITPWIGDEVSRHVIDNVTVTSSLGSNAGQFTMDWSEDGFATSHGVRQITFGTPGTQRAIARQLGSSRRRQVRLQYSGTTAPFEFDEFFGDVTMGS